MKKLILLLFPFLMLAQNPTNFPYGIKNTAATTDNTPAYFVTGQTDGVHKKTPAANIENTTNKSDSYTATSSTTYASTKALVDGLDTKVGGTGIEFSVPVYSTDGKTLINSRIYDSGINNINFNAGAYFNGNLIGSVFLDGGTNNQSVRVGNTTASLWTNSAERVTITYAGNALIGTTTDNGIDKLQVNGTISASPASLPNQVVTKAQLDAATPSTYSTIVYIDTTDPNTATVFDDVNPPIANDDTLKGNVNNLYVGTDSSIWVFSSDFLNYVTKSVTQGSNFYMYNTTVDAGNNKTSFIERSGSVKIGSTTIGDNVETNNVYATKYYGGAKLTGTPTAPTAAPGTNTTQIATMEAVQNAVSGVANSGTYTPTLTPSNTTIVAGTTYASYTKNGNIVHVTVSFQVTPTINQVPTITVTLPFNRANTTNINAGGSSIWDSSTSSVIGGQFYVNNTSSGVLRYRTGAGINIQDISLNFTYDISR